MAKISGEVEVEFEGGAGDELTMTLRGPAKVVVGVLVNGMPERALVKLGDEIDKLTANVSAGAAPMKLTRESVRRAKGRG